MIIFQSLGSSLGKAVVPQVHFGLQNCNITDKNSYLSGKNSVTKRWTFCVKVRGNWTHLIVAKIASMATFNMVTPLYVHIMPIYNTAVNRTNFGGFLKQHVSNHVSHLQAQ